MQTSVVPEFYIGKFSNGYHTLRQVVDDEVGLLQLANKPP